MAGRLRKPADGELTAMLVDSIACGFDERDEDPSLARQRVAGEEDQSQPGWDQGA